MYASFKFKRKHRKQTLKQKHEELKKIYGVIKNASYKLRYGRIARYVNMEADDAFCE